MPMIVAWHTGFKPYGNSTCAVSSYGHLSVVCGKHFQSQVPGYAPVNLNMIQEGLCPSRGVLCNVKTVLPQYRDTIGCAFHTLEL